MLKIFKVIILILFILSNVQEVFALENNQSKFFNTASIKNLQSVKNDIQNTRKAEVIVFVRDGCGNCQKEEVFLRSNQGMKDNFKVTILNIADQNNKKQWETILSKHKLSKVTPITLVGGDVLVGFNEKIVGEKILENKTNTRRYNLDFYLSGGENDSSAEDYSCTVNNSSTCSLEKGGESENINSFTEQKLEKRDEIMTLPFFDKINIKKTSLFIMSSVLGFIDGFNPCAMWVLLTFLIILSQIGDKKKMIYLAGLFILAEAIMYFLILNIWYQTWDFIKLDQIVTPLVGAIAIGGGAYFLYKYFKNREGHLTCEVTSLEHQQKTVEKIKEVVARPITIMTILAVLLLAFSVNIIEFACSVGIAQSFTKILELNQLNFISRQWYIFIYTLFYMADDFLIFGLAIVGYQKFASVGTKYSHLSSLLGGILMIILGLLLIINPAWLG